MISIEEEQPKKPVYLVEGMDDIHERYEIAPELKDMSFAWMLDWLINVPNSRVKRADWSPFVWLALVNNVFVLDTGSYTRYFHPIHAELLANDWEIIQ